MAAFVALDICDLFACRVSGPSEEAANAKARATFAQRYPNADDLHWRSVLIGRNADGELEYEIQIDFIDHAVLPDGGEEAFEHAMNQHYFAPSCMAYRKIKT